ncbi:ArsI/CadI family heavy metal resistance metalloenzyme [Paenibacillus sp. BC26]|uniref:ArsI/CadI family heavy metal resistance metalloenzyme n=1 Tax=Paenibacillus sp. BC26 TaxID=1881032 RepID=UPI0008ED2299|nr:ArsI/CadI family heavy metal resistance metalloenzyme [Paenibacillus sp. BC26]SFS53880.1 Glyoxalase/Bleomycin resistance protein/Dioxygenase superfamily protein [Paenibacillus sp. BC26]
MKMHVAINVRNLEQSLEFYKKLFNAVPTKVKENYAKFELDNPALHFSLNVRPYDSRGVLNHFGFQVRNTEEVLATKARLQEAGLVSFDEMNTTCCYAVQDKIWVSDPEGNPWEVFYTKEDSEFEAAEDHVNTQEDACCVAPAPQKVELTDMRVKNKCC